MDWVDSQIWGAFLTNISQKIVAMLFFFSPSEHFGFLFVFFFF